MFRELTRKKQVLTNEECVRILINERRGVLSVNGDNGYPYGMPMNHYYNEKDGCIYFHQGKIGHRLDSLRKNDRVSYCVYDKGERKEGAWAYLVKSVIIFGRVEILDDFNTINEISRAISANFTLDELYVEKEIEKYAKATLILKLTPEHICGKRVKEE